MRALACCASPCSRSLSHRSRSRGSRRPRTLAPFASRLRAESLDYQVKLTWRDAPDTAGQLPRLPLPEGDYRGKPWLGAPAGHGGWRRAVLRGHPPDGSGWFYAVLLRSDEGTSYTQLIPFRNVTSTPVSPASVAPEEALAARVSGLTAVVTPTGDSVQVSFRASNPRAGTCCCSGAPRHSCSPRTSSARSR